MELITRDAKPVNITAAFRLFKTYYMILAPASAMYDENEYEYFGLPTTGDAQTDVILSNQNSTFTVPVAKIAELVANGVPVCLVDPKDSIPIYNDIIQHLTDWHDNLYNSMYPKRPPLQGLHEFDQLAFMMLRIARRYGIEKQVIRDVKYETGKLFGNKRKYKPEAKSIEHSSHLFSSIVNIAKQHGANISKLNLPSTKKES